MWRWSKGYSFNPTQPPKHVHPSLLCSSLLLLKFQTDLPHEGAAVLVVDLHAVVGRVGDEAVVLVHRHTQGRLELVLRHAGVGQRLHEAARRLLEHLMDFMHTISNRKG